MNSNNKYLYLSDKQSNSQHISNSNPSYNNIGFDAITYAKSYADYKQSTSTNPKLNLSSSNTDTLDVVSFAPFLMWNEHDSKYFENVGAINTMAISDNNIYDTRQSCTNDDNYADLMKEAYFSLENSDIIQNMIIRDVWTKSNQTLRINKINHQTLIQVQNQIWTNNCRFLPYDLKEQIIDLNKKVVNYVVPLLLKESQFYFNYLRDSNVQTRTPLPPPIMITKGRKQQLPSYYK